ncbi:FAD-dependent thymidylate synthase [Catenibacterium sp.]|uniref:FAD-dependent thymidylate synthase n=1 Tax=Catenibacterium sp. TaxID=2049022 RepID=UPI002E7667D3|nr:FAD-dependent thymidylate synthase [Catenibacterium sp.]MEE0042630.1 FAD-dependent thymidylate synthase [Catenibacterium sp.]
MKLIKQSFEFINQTDFSLVGIKKHIEKCARVSYKSEDKITDTSYEKFVNMLESRGHDRPLEFGTVHLKMLLPDFQTFIHSVLTIGMFNNIWIKHAYVGDVIYITTNYRYYLDIIKYFPNVKEYFTEEDNEYYPKRYTVHMILDRGVMDEFRTHVGLSHLAESTRYCNYSKDKFNNELTFIDPCWEIKTANERITPEGTHMSSDSLEFLTALNEAEDHYLSLLAKGWTPQQARSVLPLCIKSELISCGFEDAWENFFKRRDAPDAHPMAQEIAKPMHQKFIELTKMR